MWTAFAALAAVASATNKGLIYDSRDPVNVAEWGVPDASWSTTDFHSFACEYRRAIRLIAVLIKAASKGCCLDSLRDTL